MMTNLMTILERKAFISSNPRIVLSSCPPPCGHFSIQESASGGLSYKVKKGCLLSPFQKIGTAGIFPCPLFQAYSKSILMFPCFFFNHALGRNCFLQIASNPRYGLRTAFFLPTAPHTCHFLPASLASFAHIPDPARIWHFHL